MKTADQKHMYFKLQKPLSYLSVRTSATLLAMPLSSRIGRSTLTVFLADVPVDSHVRTHICKTHKNTHVLLLLSKHLCYCYCFSFLPY